MKITLGDVMKLEQDKRRFDFHDIGKEIKNKRKASGMTQEQLAYIVDRSPRTIMYHENDGQHPSLNTFYQMVTMFDISVDQYFYPSQNRGSSPNPRDFGTKCPKVPALCACCLRPVAVAPGPYYFPVYAVKEMLTAFIKNRNKP